jgi:hypothetical protein
MKRYEPWAPNGDWEEMREEAEGEWVRYSDHAADIDEWVQINSSSLGRVRKAEDEIYKLRAALKYYADNKHYTLTHDILGIKRIDRVEDGSIARKALGEYK